MQLGLNKLAKKINDCVKDTVQNNNIHMLVSSVGKFP